MNSPLALGGYSSLRPCSTIQPDGKPCCKTPTLTERIQSGINILRVECACGAHGGSVFYSKPSDAARTRQSTVDGWNLTHMPLFT